MKGPGPKGPPPPQQGQPGAYPQGGPQQRNGPPQQGWGPPPQQGNGPPPQQGNGPPSQQGNGPPPQQWNGPPPQQGNGPPPQQGNGPPPQQWNGPPPQQGNGPPNQQWNGPPPQQGNGPPNQQWNGPPPQQGNGPPQQGWGPPPQQGYGPPQQGYGPPQQGYGPPQQGYGPPQQGYGPPQQGWGPPQQGYGQGPPGPNMWMPPITYTGPPGLFPLETLTCVLVSQEIEILELITRFETENKYKVLNAQGMQLYDLREHSSCCNRQILQEARPFTATMTDYTGTPVLVMERACPCKFCCFPICPNEVRVSTGTTNEFLGSVREKCSCTVPRFGIYDPEGVEMLMIEGPCITNPICCNDIEFPVTNASGTIVGMITKKYGDWVVEEFTDADTFAVQFPLDLDIKYKAVMIGASLLIDFMFYEKSSRPSDNNGSGHAIGGFHRGSYEEEVVEDVAEYEDED